MTKEEAIRRIKSWNLDSDDMEVLSVVVPELAESDDERVRKALISLIYENSHTYKSFAGIALDSMIAYLEKQKDPDNMIIVSPEVWDKAIANAYENGKKDGERQKEQKPAHTAKEMWKEMRLEIYAQASGNRHEPNYSDDSTKMFSLCDIDEIFEKIGNSIVGPQLPEWGEEDEVYLQDALWCVKQAAKVARGENDMGACWSAERWLESLPERFNLQPKQQWNKEDKETFEKLHRLLVICRGEKKFIQEADYNKMDNLLKSLSSRSKSSEKLDAKR